MKLNTKADIKKYSFPSPALQLISTIFKSGLKDSLSVCTYDLPLNILCTNSFLSAILVLDLHFQELRTLTLFAYKMKVYADMCISSK